MAIVGLIASLIAIFAFVTGVGSLPGLVKKPPPPPVQTPTVAPASKASHSTKLGLGTLTGPVKRIFTLPHR
jgi:hypothetical protein